METKITFQYEYNRRNYEDDCDIGRKEEENTFEEVHIKNN